MPHPPPARRCTATTRRGTRCRQWSVRGTDPPLCIRHGGPARPRTFPRQRCTATNKDGTRCRHWALRPENATPGEAEGSLATTPATEAANGQPPLCAIHAGRANAASYHTCTARTGAGKPCRARARLDTFERYGRYLCAAHVPGRTWDPPDHRRCTARNVDGTRCRQWAIPNPEPEGPGDPHRANLCVFHAGLTVLIPFPSGEAHPNWVLGLYCAPTPLEEQVIPLFRYFEATIGYARVVDHPRPLLLDPLVLTRYLIRELLGQTRDPGIPLWKLVRYGRHIIRGNRIVANLLKLRQQHHRDQAAYNAFLETLEPIYPLLEQENLLNQDP